MKLQGAPFVELSFGRQVGCMRLFGCRERAKMLNSAADANCRDEWAALAVAALPADAEQSSSSFPVRFPPVLRVDRASYVSQVVDSVVKLVAVLVVYLTGRPLAVHVQPCKAMPSVPPSIGATNGDAQVSLPAGVVTLRGSGRFANHRLLEGAVTPREVTRFGIVVKQFARSLGAKIGFSHDALQLLIGQRPRRVASTSRPRYFSAAAAFLWLAIFAGPSKAEWVYDPDADGDAAVLLDTVCQLPIPQAEFMREAVLVRKTGSFKGCWTAAPGVIGTIWEPAANDSGWKASPAKFRKVQPL